MVQLKFWLTTVAVLGQGLFVILVGDHFWPHSFLVLCVTFAYSLLSCFGWLLYDWRHYHRVPTLPPASFPKNKAVLPPADYLENHPVRLGTSRLTDRINIDR